MKQDQLSQTAAFIAIKLYGLTQSEPYRSLFDEETILFYDRIVNELPVPLNWYHRALKNSSLRKLTIFGEELLLPGDLMHIVVRKWQLQKLVEEYMKEGYQQLLVLGSGFDHLAARYSSQGVRCFEVDAPAMMQRKRQFLEKYGYTNDHLHLHSFFVSDQQPLDLLPDHPPLDPDVKTLIVCEGFFDYLSPRQTGQQLDMLNSYFNNTTTLISTVFSLEELPVFRAWVFKSSVWMVGESLKMDKNLQEITELFQDCGFKTVRKLTNKQLDDLLRAEVDNKLPLLEGFHLLVTENKK